MAIDDYSAFLFSNDNNKQVVAREIEKMIKEMHHLFDIYGNGRNINEMQLQYFGYNLDRVGEFGLILYDSKDRNKCYVPAHEIIETLKEEISMKCEFTVSIGSSRLIEDDLGMSDEWIERVVQNLKQAQKKGKNEVCFGVGGNKKDHNIIEQEFKLDVMNSDDYIQTKSVNAINVCFVNYYFFFLFA